MSLTSKSSPRSADPTGSGTLRRVLATTCLLTIVVLVGVGLTAPSKLWIAGYHEFPPASALLFIGLYVAVALLYRTDTPGPRRNALLALCLLFLYESCRVAPLGDHVNTWAAAQGIQVSCSEPGATILLHAVFHILGPEAVRHVGPIVGCVTGYLLLDLCDRLFANAGPGRRFRLRACALLYLGCGVQLTFFQGYVETTQPSLPILVLFLASLQRLFAEPMAAERRAPTGVLVGTAASLGLACFIHGQC
jgi:hypothetical protein